MNQRATIDDVAKLAGVSIATVSRVISKSERVRESTRAQVLQAIEDLHYQPDASARALASGRTYTVGCVIPTLDHSIFARATQAMQTVLSDAGFQLLVGSSNYESNTELQVVRAFQQRGVDALVLVGTDHAASMWDAVTQWGKPVLLSWSCDPRLPSVGFDNVTIAKHMTEHLLSLGHERIAVVSGFTANNDRARSRIQGVRQALSAHGLRLPKELLIEQSYNLHGGRLALQQLMQLDQPPTAIFCAMDLLAAGVLLEAQRLQIDVPRTLSVCGIDNHELAEVISPGLTTISLPTYELGRITAERVLSALSGETIPSQTILPFELIVRGSTAKMLATKRPRISHAMHIH